MLKPSITVYESDNCLRKGYGLLFREVWKELADNRWLTYQLFKRDFFAAYKQSLVGIIWIFILPLFNVATFIMLNQSGVFSVGKISVPYPIYAVWARVLSRKMSRFISAFNVFTGFSKN